MFRAEVQQSELARALGAVVRLARSKKGVVERHHTLLAHVHLRVAADRLLVSATDLELSVRAECATAGAGAVLLHGSKLHEIAVALPRGPVLLEQRADGQVRVTGGSAALTIAALDAADFPGVPFDQPHTPNVELPASALRELIDRTVFAATPEGADARYYLAGAKLLIAADGIVMVTTDGHRMSYARRAVTIAVPGAIEDVLKTGVLVPRAALLELRRLAESNSAVSFDQRGDHLVFAADTGAVAVKAIAGVFPAYERVVHRVGSVAFGVSSAALQAAVKRVCLLASERNRALKLTVRDQELELHASAPELGEARESLAIDYSGAPVEIGLNGQYVAEFLAVAGAEKVRVEVESPEHQAVFVPQGEGLPDHRYIVMPMRLS